MMEATSVSCPSSIGEKWTTVFGKFPKEEVTYFTQVTAIYIIIITCLVNLSLGNGIDTVWASLLSGSIGYLLPAPNIRKKNVAFLPDAPEQQLDEILSQQHADELRD